MTTTNTLPGIQFRPPYNKAEVKLVTRGRGSWYTINGIKHQRVTTVLNKAIPKPGLVPWARIEALASVRKTLLADFDDNPTSNWGTFVDQVIEKARAAPDQVKDTAADWGTRAHVCIAAMLRGQDWKVVPEWTPDLAPALDGFLAWQAQEGITVLDVERTVWDSRLAVAGTCDGIGRDRQGNLVVWDNKTGRAIYPEMALQVSAYTEMLEIVVGPAPLLVPILVPRAFIVRLPKIPPEDPTEAFEAREVHNVQACWDLFQDAWRLGQGLESQLWR